MRQYRKKAGVTAEAEQWFPSKTIAGVYPPIEGELLRHYVRTAHHQVVFLEPGEWVVQEPDGRGAYPIKRDIFAAQYEPADTPDPCWAALEAARHELTTLHGLWVFDDSSAQHDKWPVDTSAALAQIDAVLGPARVDP